MAPRSTLDERRAITVMGRTMSQKAISAATGRPLPTVNRVLRAFYEEGRLADAVRRRPERAPTDEEDRLIVAASVENPFLTAREIRDILGLDVSTETIRRRLHSAAIKSRIAAQRTQLEQTQKQQRMDFASVVENWTPNNWRAVVFSDEATFCTRWDQRQRVWRPERTR
ncbi:hypothetical protein HPB52_024792 [Rhipicephalus sanguineus]|uniref:Transposase Tc1-like domain-containing protein n=1 Tax=Rhipicephalus sanguineus TaxID=34632 RepID=A0A9D4TDY2_RHISA|nr:hypothetical protein HPB52_024792 [Rhipicephalus sanguineus]